MILGSHDLVMEQAYLVERGVRPAAIFNHEYDPEKHSKFDLDVALDVAVDGGTLVPFVIDDGKIIGIAQHEWAVNLITWARTNCPTEQWWAIVGLLLGYSSRDIEDFCRRDLPPWGAKE